MAKMIKCPTCQTPIEVPAQLTGQIVKCPGCGKSLKLVAKKPAGQQPAPGSSLAGQSMSGSLSGQSMSAMTYVGEPPPLDDLPSLDANCVVCGRPTDPEKLIEDNGRMVCPDCVKGARSRIDRPTGGAEMLGFKAPMPAPVRRGNIINISPSFLIGAVAALVLIACQLYLMMYEKPVGTLTKPTQAALTKPAGPAEPDPFAPPAATEPAETAPVATTAPAPTATQPSTAAPTEVATASPAAPDAATKPAEPTTDTIFNETTTPAATAPPTAVPPAPGIPPPGVQPGAIATAANDPLAMGIEKLQTHDWAGAGRLLDQARTKYVLRRMGEKLTPEQQMTLVGLAAAYLGQNNPQAAKAPLDIVMSKGQKNRSAVLNNAIMVLSKRSPPRELGDAIRMVREYLGPVQGDEYAANIFGTLLDRAGTVTTATAEEKAKLQEAVDFLDRYNDQMASAHDGQLKWGTEWLQADLVRSYRANRGKPANAVAAAAPDQLKRDLEAAQAKVFQMQQAVTQAKASGGDVIGAENQLNAALANMGRLQMQLNQAGAPPRAPVWLTKFEPVVPEGVLIPQ